MANRAQAFGMTVIAHDPFACGDYARSHNIELVDLITLAERCDVLSIHCPDIEATRGVVDQTLLNRMKPTAILINTARGPIVNETDLIDALRRGQIQAAGLDVYEAEPPASDNPLFELENVVLTPHSAGGEQLAMRDMAIESAQCIVSLFAGHWPEGAVVNDQLRSSWKW